MIYSWKLWLEVTNINSAISILKQGLTKSQIPVMFDSIFFKVLPGSCLHWTEFEFPITEVPFLVGTLNKKLQLNAVMTALVLQRFIKYWERWSSRSPWSTLEKQQKQQQPKKWFGITQNYNSLTQKPLTIHTVVFPHTEISSTATSQKQF